MTAGYHHAAVCIKVMKGEIGNGGGDHSNIHNIASGGVESLR